MIPKFFRDRQSRLGDASQFFGSANALELETLEVRQMLSSAVLSDTQLVETAVRYLQDNAADYGLTASDLDHYSVSSQYTTDHLGISHIYLTQTYQGLEVRDGVINVNVSLDGVVVSAGSSFVTGLTGINSSVVPRLNAQSGLRALVDHYQWTSSKAPELIRASTSVDRAGRFTRGDLSVDEIPVELQFVPKDGGGVELAWTFVVRLPHGQGWMHSSVSALDGRFLAESNWIDDAMYNVFNRPLDGPLYGGQSIVIDPNDLVASPFGWHDLDGIPGHDSLETVGNNVHAQLDRFATDSGQGQRATGGVNLEFLYTYEPSSQPVVSADAANTNLFFWNNFLHDVHYHYGFNEAAGNFQENNYGRGGLGGDSVQADSQYGAALNMFNNAFFGTPPDGQTPQMSMLEWRQPPIFPNRDSDYENTVIVHEFGHGVSNRLTGGPANADALNDIQSAGMGEGWSDFWALMMNQTKQDQANNAVPLANWLIFDDLLLTPGIRRYPYSFNMNVNPLTFADYNTSSEVHDAGEIWASVLWDLNWFLINGEENEFNGKGFSDDLIHGTAGNNIALQLVMDGLKLQPANPSFLEARNAILLADRLNNNGANQLAIWTAFARRGMGFSAEDGGSRSRTVVEAFDIPNFSEGVISFNRNSYEIGKDTIRIELFDIDLAGQGTHVVTVESNSGDIQNVVVTESSPGQFFGSVQSKKGTIYFQNGVLEILEQDTLTATYYDADTGNGAPGTATDTALVSGTLPGGGGGTTTTYVSTDVPKVIPNLTTITSTITINQTYPIGDVNVTLDITHPLDEDMDVFLISPNGTRVELFTDVGGFNANFTNTTLDDEATTPITAGAAPFTGSFRPEGSLATFDNMLVTGIWTLEVTDDTPTASGTLNSWSLTILNANFGQKKFDFGFPAPVGPIAKDFIGIGSAAYAPAIGYGWLPDAISLNPLMRVDGSRLSRDFVYLRKGTFGVDVPNGIYDITVFIGETLNAHDQMGIYIEGRLQETVDTAGGEVATRLFRATVKDGQLSIGFKDLGGLNAFVTVAGIIVKQVDQYRFDFGTSTSPVSAGFQQATSALYTANRGYGWLGDTVARGVLERSTGSALNRDLAFLKLGTFAVDLPSGDYMLEIYFGDTLNAHDLMGVWLEGTFRNWVTTAAGQILKSSYQVNVADGQLNIFFDDLGGANQYVTIVGMTIGPPGSSSFAFADAAAGTPVGTLISGDNGKSERTPAGSAAGALPLIVTVPMVERVQSASEAVIDFSRYSAPLVASENQSKSNPETWPSKSEDRWQLRIG